MPFFEDYKIYTAKSESPDIFHIWTALGTIAAAIPRSVWVDFQAYKIFPNQYIILVAGSAVCRKSSALDFGRDLLKRMDKPPPVFSQKLTTEALIKFMQDHQGHGTAVASELAVFLGADSAGSGLLAALCDIYDCKDNWSYQTRGRGEELLKFPYLNILAASTLDWLRYSLPRDAIGGGFTSRVLFVYGSDRRFKEALPFLGPQQIAARKRLVDRLNVIYTIKGAFAIPKKTELFYRDWYETQTMGTEFGMGGYYGRKQTHVLKISMLVSLAERDDLVLTQEHVQKAILLLSALESFMPEAVSEVYASQSGQETSVVLDHIKKCVSIDHSVLQKRVWRHMRAKELNEALSTLASAGVIERIQDPKTSKRSYRYLQ